MKEFTYTITDPEGIHARPAGELVKAAKAFESAIKLNKEGKSADCKRVFGIMGLAVKQGQTVTVTVEGSDEEAAAPGNGEFLQDNSVTLSNKKIKGRTPKFGSPPAVHMITERWIL